MSSFPKMTDQERERANRAEILASAHSDLERQAAALTGSPNYYEPGMRRTLWKLMVGSHAFR